jgi:hypothetical protein
LLAARVERAGHVADVGCGSGAGGLLLASRAASVQLLDINPAALELARVNAELNGLAARVARSDILSGAEGPLDLVIANPPCSSRRASLRRRWIGSSPAAGCSSTRRRRWPRARELDPDVFGEELERPAYAGVDRIAVVALDAVKR